MQRRIDDEVQLGSTVSPFDATGESSSVDRKASNFLNASEKVQKIKGLLNTGEYDQGMIENIDTKEKFAHIS